LFPDVQCLVGRIAFAPIFEKCNLSFAPQGYISFAQKKKKIICAIFQVTFA
jgi:hypothetical protein